MLILSRKPGESVVIGGTSFPATAGPGPDPPVRGGAGPSGGGESSPAACAAVAENPGRSDRGRSRTGSDRRRDRPPRECGGSN